MKARGVAIQGALAAVALGTAYFSWQQPPEGSPSEVTVLDLGNKEIEKIRYEDAARWVELAPAKDDAVLISYAQKPPPPPKAPEASKDGGVVASAAVDAGQQDVIHDDHDEEEDAVRSSEHGPKQQKPDAATAAKTKPLAPPRTVKGTEQAEKLIKRFGPLKAARSLGSLPAEKLKELGLEGSNRKIEVTARGSQTVFSVGTSVMGNDSPYLKNEKDGKVYLLSGTVLSELEAASSRLIDRRLHTFKANEFDGLNVKAEKGQRELIQKVEADNLASRIASAKTPDKSDEFAKNWNEKVMRLVATEVLGQGETPASGEPKVTLRMDYFRKGKPIGFLELARGAQNEIFARSEHTVGWVMLPANAADVIKEAEKVAEGS